jgi:hypothetical protein
MKEGFYLSPDGLHVIEIFIVASTRVCDSIDLFYYSEYPEICRVCCDGDVVWLNRFLLTWEFLE